MLLRNEAKVGLIVFIAIIMLIAVYWFLGTSFLQGSTYTIYAIFGNAQKLDKGADVRMAGVKVGSVSDVRLTRKSQARVDMVIINKSVIPSDSIARITSGGFIGDNYVEILPGTSKSRLKDGDRIASETIMQFDQLMTELGSLISDLRTSAAGINVILGDKKVLASVKETVLSLKDAAGSASNLIASAQKLVNTSSPDIQAAFANLRIASDDATRISKTLEDILVTDARPNVRAIMSEARGAVTNLNDAMAEAKDLISAFREDAGKIGQTLSKVDTIATEAQQLITNLNETTAGIKALATDCELQQNVKTTMRNIAVTSEQARELITNLNRKLGSTTCPVTPAQKAAIPFYGLSTNSLWRTGDGDYRFDANYTFGGCNNAFYRVGAYNIGENTRLNLQYGTILDQENAVRFGLYASRLGVGYDRHVGQRTLLSADLFRPNKPELELRGVYRIQDGFGLYTGIADLFNTNKNGGVLVGVTYQK